MNESATPQLLSRTGRFAQFLREAAAARVRSVLRVDRYPQVVWFGSLPSALAEVRSPLFTESWLEDDTRWLVVARATAPILPPAPAECRDWLVDVLLTDPLHEPVLTAHRVQDDELERAEPPEEVRSAWGRYLEERWRPWAARARAARQVSPIYEKLFAIHQEMQGREDSYELFLGVGCLHKDPGKAEEVRRHVLAFPAEISLDARTGTLAVHPAEGFESAQIETDFLPAASRAALKRQEMENREILEEIGTDVHRRDRVGAVVSSIVHALDSRVSYDANLALTLADGSQPRASFAPALILRPRTTRSLDLLLAGIEQAASQGHQSLEDRLPLIWRRIMEDPAAYSAMGSDDREGNAGTVRHPPMFPLPSNDEQSRIVEYGEDAPGVVVQGPPGTGKSHTIANLIAHYLANGQRVLVTAEKAQALQVLRDKLPPEIQPLCVSLLGDSRESGKELARSVHGILRRAQGPGGLERLSVSDLQSELDSVEAQLRAVDTRLAKSRQRETEVVGPVEGYEGTLAALAQRLETESAALGWIEGDVPFNAPCPHWNGSYEDLARYHASMTTEALESLSRRWRPLPFTPDEAIENVSRVVATRAACPTLEPPPGTESLGAEDLGSLATWLGALQQGMADSRTAGWAESVRLALLSGDTSVWKATLDDVRQATARLSDSVVAEILPCTVREGRRPAEVRRDLERLREHYDAGGTHRRMLILTPAVVRETAWLESAVELDGVPIRRPDDVPRAIRALDGQAALDAAWRCWGDSAEVMSGTPRQQVAELRGRAGRLARWLALEEGRNQLPARAQQWLGAGASAKRPTSELLQAVELRAAQLDLEHATAERDRLLGLLPGDRDDSHAPSLALVERALQSESLAILRAALLEHEEEREARTRHEPWCRFMEDVQRSVPRLAHEFGATAGSGAHDRRLAQLPQAWAYARVRSWLRAEAGSKDHDAIERSAAALRQRVQDLRAQIVAAHAWRHGIARIDERTRSAMAGWSLAVQKIPKTGPSVFRKRAAARKQLERCLPGIPAWVVSLNRLYETVDATPGRFDIAIVDEASQCWLDALILFYLAKRVIVVGDDKQISPTVVGVKDGEVEGLAKAYLPDFEDRALFTIDTSLFDHARRYLRRSLSLREHFRCMPEIIRFSNDLCYADDPLIPLRQATRDRLPPLQATHVPGAVRRGDINDAEARAVVDAIRTCHGDERYGDANFGVICLQGDDQAKHIEALLLESLGPGIFAERRLRCGNAYAFQGDERDVMFLSMVVSPHESNAALTRQLFEQRFNVAMSRAKDQMWLFHSVQHQDLSSECLRRRALEFFYQEPDSAILGVPVDVPRLRLAAARAVRIIERPPQPFDSWFEVDVALALVDRGFQLSAQVKVASRSIDLVVEGPGGRVAVECDGDVWHGPERWESDMDRQRQLERAGWRFIRVRASRFYSDRSATVRAIYTQCAELGIFDDDEEVGGPATSDSASSDDQQYVASGLVAAVPLPSDSSFDDDADPQATDTSVDVDVAQLGMPGFDSDHLHSGEQAGKPFTGYEEREYPDPHDAAPLNVRGAVLDIVRRDGPLPKAAIYQLYREGCPAVTRAGKNLRKAVNSAISVLQRMGDLIVWDEGNRKSPEDVIVRLAGAPQVVVRPAGRRGLDDIPPSELAQRLRGERNEAPRDASARLQLYRTVLRAYDIRQLRQTMLPRLELAARLAYDEEYASDVATRAAGTTATRLPL